MLARFLSLGVFLLAGTQGAFAADPLIPPAPTTDPGKGATAAPAVPSPPDPHLPKSLPKPSLPGPDVQGKESLPPVAAPSATSPGAAPKKSAPAPIPESIPEQPAAVAPPASGVWSAAPPTPGSPGISNHGAPGHGMQFGTVPGQFQQPNFVQQPEFGWPVMPQPWTSDPWMGQSQDPRVGMPPYNSFATQSVFPPYFHTGPAGGEHVRFPYYSYRRPWYTPGPMSRNVNIVW